MRASFVGELLLPAIAAICALSVIRVMAVNVDLPDEFVQCQPAAFGFSKARGNVTIIIRKAGYKTPHLNISLGEDAKNWTWSPVDFPADENFTVLVTDVSAKRKSKSLFQSVVDPSTNDTCLPAAAKTKGKPHHDKGNDDGDEGDEGTDGLDDGFGPPPAHHSKKSTTEVAVIAGVLGGVLFALLGLTVIMCLRRRQEHRNVGAGAADGTADDDDGRPMVAQRIRDMQTIPGPHRVVTLYGPDGHAEGQAVLGREGDAGWSYMSRMVPGLETGRAGATTAANATISGPLHPSGRRRFVPTKRYDEEGKDTDLPSYGMSEYERKNLPKYEAPPGGRQTPMVLTTRRDSQGSRLTFSPEAQETMADQQTYSSRRSLAPSQIGSFVPDGHIRRSISSRRSQFDLPTSRRHNIEMAFANRREDRFDGRNEEDDDANGVIVFGNERASFLDGAAPAAGQTTAADTMGASANRSRIALVGAPERPAAPVGSTSSVHDSDTSSLSQYAAMLDYEERPAAATSGVEAASAAGDGNQFSHRRSRSESGMGRSPFL